MQPIAERTPPTQEARLQGLGEMLEAGVHAVLQSPEYQPEVGDTHVLADWLARVLVDLPGIDPEAVLARARRRLAGQWSAIGWPKLWPPLLALDPALAKGDRSAQAEQIGRQAARLGATREGLADLLHLGYPPGTSRDWLLIHRHVLQAYDAASSRRGRRAPGRANP
jgi:hypothetical protein